MCRTGPTEEENSGDVVGIKQLWIKSPVEVQMVGSSRNILAIIIRHSRPNKIPIQLIV